VLDGDVVVEVGHQPRLPFYRETLIEEVFKRCRVRWAAAEDAADTTSAGAGLGATVRLSVDRELAGVSSPEGYTITTRWQGEDGVGRSVLSLVGASERGVLFAVGRLLREMCMDFHQSYAQPLRSVCFLPRAGFMVVSSPSYKMRQHQGKESGVAGVGLVGIPRTHPPHHTRFPTCMLHSGLPTQNQCL
jgi:hypothetical protein